MFLNYKLNYVIITFLKVLIKINKHNLTKKELRNYTYVCY